MIGFRCSVINALPQTYPGARSSKRASHAGGGERAGGQVVITGLLNITWADSRVGRFPVLVGIGVVSLPTGNHGPHLSRMFVGDCYGRLVIANPVVELDHP